VNVIVTRVPRGKQARAELVVVQFGSGAGETEARDPGVPIRAGA